MNLVILTGRLGADIDVQTSNGTTYCHFSLASNHRAKNGDDYEDRVTWTRVTAFHGLASSLRNLGKGSLIELRGHLKTTVFEKGDVRIEHSEVIADWIGFQQVKKPASAQDRSLESESEGDPGKTD